MRTSHCYKILRNKKEKFEWCVTLFYNKLKCITMIQYKNGVWLGGSIVVLALILNVFLIKTAFTNNADLYWLLIATIPLLSVGIYIAWLTNRLRQKYNIDSQQFDSVKPDFKWLPQPGYASHAEEIDLRIAIGNNQCRQPYRAPLFNMESMMNIQNEKSVFHILKEEKIDNLKNSLQGVPSTYSFGDGLVWQIRPDYPGCCSKNGHFNGETFKINAGSHEIKMIELILSSSHKGKYRVDSIFEINETPVAKKSDSVFQEAGYSTFTEAEGMIHFLDSLRKLSGGKPVGIRFCINDKKEFYKICYAIQKTKFIPDFIVVEGSVKSQPVANFKKESRLPIPLYEALQFVSATLRMYSLENEIKVIAAGEIISGFDILKMLSLGADLVYCEMDNYDRINYSSKKSQFRKGRTITDIHNKHTYDIIKIMQTAGFRKISDITLPNLFRSMESIPAFTEPIKYQGSVRSIYISKLDVPAIKNKRKKEYVVL